MGENEVVQSSSPSDTPPLKRMRKSNEAFHCKDCGKVFKRAWSLVQHLWTHTGDRPFKCDHCKISYNSLKNLQKHQRFKHKILTDGNGEEMEKEDGNEEQSGVTVIEDESADKTQTTPGENGTTNSENAKLVKVTFTCNNQACVCDKCGRKFSSRSRLTSHLRFHQGKTIYRCLYCGVEFINKVQLKQHEKTHIGEKPYKCHYCPKVFHFLAKLYTHIRAEHKEVSQVYFACYECKKQFPTKMLLVAHHTAVHKKERYQCIYCQQKFLNKTVLRDHERRNHSQETLEVSSTTYKSPSKTQESACNSVACEICGKNFPNRTQKELHQLTHVGKEPYQCKYCPMSFINGHVLMLHELNHTGEQPYKCDYCGRWFAILGNLLGHIRTQHPDKKLPDKGKFDFLKKLPNRSSSVPPPASESAPKVSAKQSSVASPQTPTKQIIKVIKIISASPKSTTKLSPQASSISTAKPSPQASSKSTTLPSPQASSKSTTKSSPQASSKSTTKPSPQASSKSTTKPSPQASSKGTTKPLKSPQASPKHTTKPSQASPKSATSKPPPRPPLTPSPSSPPTPSETPPPLHVFKINFNSDKPYVCEYCNKGFRTKHHLIEHRYIHIGKPLSCDICGLGFIRQSKLELHLTSHRGKKMFNCLECDYSFESVQKLKTHKFKDHLDHGEKGSLRCLHCDKSFHYKSNFRQHMASHFDEMGELKEEENEIPVEIIDQTPIQLESRKSDSTDLIVEKQFTCQDCGTVVTLDSTSMSNVFSVTNFSNVKCLLENHKLI